MQTALLWREGAATGTSCVCVCARGCVCVCACLVVCLLFVGLFVCVRVCVCGVCVCVCFGRFDALLERLCIAEAVLQICTAEPATPSQVLWPIS